MLPKYGKDFPFNLIHRLPEDPFIGTGLKPEGPNRNLCNFLRTVVTGNANLLFLNTQDYVAQSPITYDPDLVEDNETRLCEVLSVSNHTSRSNISVKCFKIVRHKYTMELQREIRTYNIVRDGRLVLKEMDFKLDADTFGKLRESEIINKDVPYSSETRYAIDLEKLPTISPAWANAPILRLDKCLENEQILSQMMCAIRAYAKKIGLKLSSEDFFDNQVVYSREIPDQNSLKTAVHSYGMKIYKSKKRIISPASKMIESYEAKHSTISLANEPAKIEFSTKQLEELLEQRLNISRILRDTRYRINCIKIALEEHGKAIYWHQIPTPPRFNPETIFFEGSIFSLDYEKDIKLIKKEWPERIYLYKII